MCVCVWGVGLGKRAKFYNGVCYFVYTATENTYYKTSVRGKTVTVFCDMSSDPATTYYDMEAWTKFFQFEISWHKIRLLLDNCMTSVMTVDTKFSSEANPITGSWNG